MNASSFALYTLYINLEKVAGKKHSELISSVKKKQKQLNELLEVNYEEVIRFKLAVLKELYHAIGLSSSGDHEYKHFFEDNKHWLVPYAAFCYLRDKYATSHYNEWSTHSVYDKDAIDKLFHSSASKDDIGFYCFVQYQLHLQLKEAADYAHKKRYRSKR